jgi:hypothetical protein
MRIAIPSCALVLVVLSLGSGCRLFDEDASVQGQSLLRPATPSPESVLMEVIWARIPLDDPELCNDVWAQIDETRIAPAVRRELARNGFRVGVIAGTPPDAVARALNMNANLDSNGSDQGADHLSSLDVINDPKVHGSRRNLRRGERMEIRASETVPSMPLLVSRGSELGGRTYRDAQAIYALRIDPQRDQTVKVELTPELHYGPSRLRFSGVEEGMDVAFRQLPMRDREVFESMRMDVELAPGEMLMLTSLPHVSSRPGHYFHTTQSSAGREQKLVLVRLAQVPRSDTFADSTSF